MYAMFVELNAKPEHADTLRELLAGLTQVAASEAGALAYLVHRQPEHPGRFMLYELYRDQPACQAHLDDARVRAVLARFDTLLASPPRIDVCEPLAAFGVARAS